MKAIALSRLQIFIWQLTICLVASTASCKKQATIPDANTTQCLTACSNPDIRAYYENFYAGKFGGMVALPYTIAKGVETSCVPIMVTQLESQDRVNRVIAYDMLKYGLKTYNGARDDFWYDGLFAKLRRHKAIKQWHDALAQK